MKPRQIADPKNRALSALAPAIADAGKEKGNEIEILDLRGACSVLAHSACM
jgi:hypothetical protein